MDYGKEKIGNLIVYFVKKTKKVGITKLCKLLYYADYRHFKEAGESITGMVYKAWDKGPVPSALYGEIVYSPEKLKDFISVNKIGNNYQFIPKKEFDDQYFTDRELRIINEIVYMFKNCTAKDISDSTHFPNEPWKRIIKEKKRGAVINYELAFDNRPETISLEKYKELKKNRDIMEKIFSHNATR